MDPSTSDARRHLQRMLAGDRYLATDPVLVEQRTRAATLVEEYNQTPFADSERRFGILSDLLGSFGIDSEIRGPIHFDYGFQTRIGTGTFINFGLVALDVASIEIGDDVQIGPNVQLLTATHPLAPTARRAKWESASPITIGDNVWLGGGVIVCPGVTIGNDTVVGAGGVVTEDLPPSVLAVGVPARPIKSLAEE